MKTNLFPTSTENQQYYLFDKTAHTTEFADLFGERNTYGYIYKDKKDEWKTSVISIEKGQRNLPMVRGENGKFYYHIILDKKTIKSKYKSGKIIGLRYGNQARHIVIDIDAPSKKSGGSIYHPDVNKDNWDKLIRFISKQFGDHIAVRSSNSGGYHIYIFMESFENSDRIAHAVEKRFLDYGYKVVAGQIEIFPNTRKNYVNRKGFHDVTHKAVRLPCIDESNYVVDTNTLEFKGWRKEFLELAQKTVPVHRVLGTPAEVSSPVLADREKIEEIKDELDAIVLEETTPDELKVVTRIYTQAQIKKLEETFNLRDRFDWGENCRSNMVIGAHVAFVVEKLRIYNPIEIGRIVWERLKARGYDQNASEMEKRDQGHLRRWIASALSKCELIPLTKKENTGSGDNRLNEERSKDSQYRFNLAIEHAKHEGITFPSETKAFKWINEFLKKCNLATIGGGTWQKIKAGIEGLLNKEQNSCSISKGENPHNTKPIDLSLTPQEDIEIVVSKLRETLVQVKSESFDLMLALIPYFEQLFEPDLVHQAIPID